MARATKAYSAGSVKYDITCASLPIDFVLSVEVTFDVPEDISFLSFSTIMLLTFSSLSRNLNPFRRSLFRSAFILPVLRNVSIECVRNYNIEEKKMASFMRIYMQSSMTLLCYIILTCNFRQSSF